MKGCREKANNFPGFLTCSILPQMMALYEVLEYIFNRNSCLLPAYFIITEIQKPDNAEVHWVSSIEESVREKMAQTWPPFTPFPRG